MCDNTTTSPYYGNCYTEWDQAYGTGDVSDERFERRRANLETRAWRRPITLAGLGGEPLVQPNGTVIVPFQGGGIDVFSSTNGGSELGQEPVDRQHQSHVVAGGLRNPDLPSASIDGAGKVFVVWSDCRFRTSCAANDIVMSSSSDGKTWSAVTRIPIDATTSTVDHFLPGIGVDPTTSGSNAHLTIVYYYYPIANCTASTCQLDVGFTTSTDGGATWTAGAKIAGPMKLAGCRFPTTDRWSPTTSASPTSNGNPFGVFAVAQAPSGTTLQRIDVHDESAAAGWLGALRASVRCRR